MQKAQCKEKKRSEKLLPTTCCEPARLERSPRKVTLAVPVKSHLLHDRGSDDI